MTARSPLQKLLYCDNTSHRRYHKLTILKTGVRFTTYEYPVLAGSTGKYFPNHGSLPAELKRRDDNLSSLRSTVHDLVSCNVNQYGYEAIFLTFTFRENITDLSFAWKEWHKFIKRFTRKYFAPKYLCVVEFQARGAVHFHCIFFNLDSSFENERSTRNIANLWGQGFVDLERIRSAKNVASYVTSYLDASAQDERLVGLKFYSTSRGLYRPVVFENDDALIKFSELDIDKNSVSEFISKNGNKHLTYNFNSYDICN